ncbi:MAG: FAD-dependent oxidoreductase [Anaerolineaceae bacterium]|nr:FAD-dependent oxidoreductase [Anaerolineaceae bacterium]
MNKNYPKLFTPGRIGSLRIKNRAVMPPMQVLYGENDGHPGPRTIAYYEERAKGGAGLIIIEATAVDDINNTLWDHQLSLAANRFRTDWMVLTEAIHKHDCRVFIQLHHYGAKSALTPSGAPWAPSEIPALPGGKPGHKMTIEEIQIEEQRFIQAAVRAKESGFDGVELAGTHGYLLAQFLSPYYNNRTDMYGGSTENRCRFYTELIQGIHAACGKDFPVSVRFPGDEFTPEIPNTLTLKDGLEIAKILEQAGADCLNVSNGNNFNANANCEPFSYVPGWKKHVAKAVHDAVSIPVLATNTIKNPEFAEQMLEEGVSDFVCLGRALIADPAFMNKAAQGDSLGIRKCLGCMFCREQLYAQMPIRCALNPRVGFEYLYQEKLPRDGEGRMITVIGGGPAGMEAAGVLQSRGFDVTLFEKEATLAGSMNLADKAYHKEKITYAAQTLEEELRRLGVKIILNHQPTVEEIRALAPAGVVLACGARPIIPPVPGADLANVVTSHDVIAGKAAVQGDALIVGSGMTGLECAEKLCMEGHKVSIVEMLDHVGTGMFSVIVADLMTRIKPHAPAIYTSHRLLEITPKGVLVEDLSSGTEKQILADTVILSLGVRPDEETAEMFRAAFEHVLVLGDNEKSGRIPHAIKDGYLKASAFLKD